MENGPNCDKVQRAVLLVRPDAMIAIADSDKVEAFADALKSQFVLFSPKPQLMNFTAEVQA